MLAPLGRLGQGVHARAREVGKISVLFYAAIKGGILERGRGRRMVARGAATQVYFTAVEPLGIFLLVAVICRLLRNRRGRRPHAPQWPGPPYP